MFFVMLITQDGEVTALMDDTELALYSDKIGAGRAAAANPLGEAFGWYVYEVGKGWVTSCT